MRPRRVLPIVILASLFMIFTQIVPAARVGRIKGTITDAKTGQPLFGVSVQIKGTVMGAKSNFDGEYIILSVPPGKYDLVFICVGYESIEMTDVEVMTDSTTIRSVAMNPVLVDSNAKGVDMSKIEIDFRKMEVQKPDKTQQIRLAPVATVNDLMQRETGISGESNDGKTVRGGRAGETTYRIDGVRHSMKGVQMNCLPLPGEPAAGYPPAHGGTAIVNGQAYDAMFFKNYGVNPFVDTEDDSLSTFAIDVDDASYIMMRSYIERGDLPPDEAVRVEEFVNHFDYGYDPPYNRPFDVYLEGSPSKFGQNCYLLRIGIKGLEVRPEDRKPANLVFVVDVSGSMGREDRLGLVRKALRMLVDELRDDDRVGIVIYGSRGQVVLQPTSVRRRDDILRAIEVLVPQGATNAEEGLDLGYAMADRMFEPGKINRIILCSDGVANVGRTGPDDILKKIKKYADKGITLSTVGFGMGNYNDILMEKLGNKGNGSYAYVDDITEARRIFVDNLTGNLQVIARDVKIQVEFDPRFVRSYRLLGYENRDVADDKFRDDKEDGGEIGAGHSVTALYEIKLKNQRRYHQRGNIGTIFIRHKNPDDFEVTENRFPVNETVFARTFNSCSPQFRLAAAAAEFAEILRKSYWAKGSSLEDVLTVVKDVDRDWENDDVLELMHLVSKAAKIKSALAEK